LATSSTTVPIGGGTTAAPDRLAPLVGLTASALQRSPVESVAPAAVEQPAAGPPSSDAVEADTDWTIDGEFTFPGELSVGGTFVVGPEARVIADIRATNAVIHGCYKGTLKATGTIFVTPTALVTGVLESPEVVVLDGAIVNGRRAGEVDTPEPTKEQVNEEEIFIPSPVHRQGKTLI
jgi:cytoskeletal protein CcmA (bactofilin family)